MNIYDDDHSKETDAYSSIPKSYLPVEQRFKMAAGSFYIPKPDKLKPLGEDSHFICAEKETFGAADGVGGWAKKGVDAGKYARALMFNSELAVRHQPMGWVDPRKVLEETFSKTEARGSSTACILTLGEHFGQILGAVNIGDSGFVVIRNGKIEYKSRVQQHRFNCPFQLGKGMDNPSLAQGSRVFVEPGDVVVAGTDGLFDNLNDSDIVEIVVNQEVKKAPHKLARTIAKLAHHNPRSPKIEDRTFEKPKRIELWEITPAGLPPPLNDINSVQFVMQFQRLKISFYYLYGSEYSAGLRRERGVGGGGGFDERRERKEVREKERARLFLESPPAMEDDGGSSLQTRIFF